MGNETDGVAHLEPLLFRHAITRTSSVDLPGYYDDTKQLWVVDTKCGVVAVVEAVATSLIEINASTRVSQERVDQDGSNAVELYAIAFAETTLTAVQMEIDDQDASTELTSIEALLDTHTLTEVQPEGDDTDAQLDDDDRCASTRLKCFNALFDTHTLTKVRQEADDTDITSDETLVARRRLGTLAELSTKTDVQQETDDQVSADQTLAFGVHKFNNNGVIDNAFPSMLLELQTKTFADDEGGDDGLPMIH